MGCLLTVILAVATVSSGLIWGWQGVLVTALVILVAYINLGIVFLNTQFSGSHLLAEMFAISVVTGLAAWVLWVIGSTTSFSINSYWLLISWGVGVIYSAREDIKERNSRL